MKLSNEMKVGKAYLSEAVPIGNLGMELFLSVQKFPGINMTFTGQGLYIEYKDTTAFIPSSNLKGLVFL